jgi:glycosyltransferase involved in cell wall biosynthesis
MAVRGGRASDGNGRRSPELTVVIVAGRHRDRARQAIESVLDRSAPERIELIVVDLDADADPAGLEGIDPRVMVVRMGRETTFGQARAHAVSLAAAPVIAFLEEHCRAHPGWASALLNAHQGPWACVGPEVHSMNPGVGWSDSVYLLGYSAWMPPAEAGETSTTVAHNSSYKADALRPFAGRLAELLLVEPLLQAELRQRGHRLYVEPQAKFSHINESGLRSLRAFVYWNRCLGRIRSATPPWTLTRRVAYTVLSPLVPFVRTFRDMLRSLRTGRPAPGVYLRHVPRILVLHFLATVGLLLGSWLGTETDDVRFTDFELRDENER